MLINSISDQEDTLDQLTDGHSTDFSLEKTLVSGEGNTLQDGLDDSDAILRDVQWSLVSSSTVKHRPSRFQHDENSTFHSLHSSFLSELSDGESMEADEDKNYSLKRKKRSIWLPELQNTSLKRTLSISQKQKAVRYETINFQRPVSRRKMQTGLLKELTHQLLYGRPSTKLINADRSGTYQAVNTMRTSVANLRKAYGYECVKQALNYANAYQRQVERRCKEKSIRPPTISTPQRRYSSCSVLTGPESNNWLRLILMLPKKESQEKENDDYRDKLRFRIFKDAPMIVLMMAIARLFNLAEPAKIKLCVKRKRSGSHTKYVKPCDNARTLGLTHGDALVLDDQSNLREYKRTVAH